jgi:transcriptional regulator with XRE-family HTH domain
VLALLRGHQPRAHASLAQGQRQTPTTVPNLRAVRQALGVSFKEFARFAGISESHLANLETGKRRASRKMQRRLVAAVARLRVKHPERWERIKEIAG